MRTERPKVHRKRRRKWSGKDELCSQPSNRRGLILTLVGGRRLQTKSFLLDGREDYNASEGGW